MVLLLAGFGGAPVVESIAQDLVELLFALSELLGLFRGEMGLFEGCGCGRFLLCSCVGQLLGRCYDLGWVAGLSCCLLLVDELLELLVDASGIWAVRVRPSTTPTTPRVAKSLKTLIE